MKRIRIMGIAFAASLAVSAMATASASAFLKEWYVESSAVGATAEEVIPVNSPEVTTFKLTQGTRVLTCTQIGGTSVGEVEAGGKDKVKKLVFEGCTTTKPTTCEVKSEEASATGIIEVKTAATKLQTENAGILADEFIGNGGSGHQLVKLEFSGTSCGTYTNTEVRGAIAAECENLTTGAEAGHVKLTFPSPALKLEAGQESLHVFGSAATMTGSAKEKAKTAAKLECK